MPGIAQPQISESDPDSVSFPPIFKSHIDNCQFSAWYSNYSRFSPKARVFSDLPEPFIEYLLADGIILPPESDNSGPTGITPGTNLHSRIQDLSVSDDTASSYSDDGEAPEDPSLKFKNLHDDIKTAIADLGGSVIPKLNWSTPKDASWITLSNTLKCQSPSDIYLLLKSSSFITHDLTDPYVDTVEATESKLGTVLPPSSEHPQEASSSDDLQLSHELVLRQWFNINPALEFRCFVKDRQLVGICQRDYLKYYSFLWDLKDQLADEIEGFFEDNLQHTFPDESFVFDVYVPEPYDCVYLIDINPFAPQTDPLLFTWYEVLHKLGRPTEGTSTQNDAETDDLEFRLVEKSGATSDLLGGGLQHSENRVPKDIVDASMTGEGMAELARRWNAMLNGEELSDSDDSDEEEEK